MEIERRFLVRCPSSAMEGRGPASHIIQGYFGCTDGLRLRVRIASDERDRDRAFLTFKGARRGFTRLEFEYPLAVERARRALAALPPGQIIRKTRYEVIGEDGLAWSVDHFHASNQGLVLAEIELVHPGQKFKRPAWLGAEITFDPRYGNSHLAWAPMPRPLAEVA